METPILSIVTPTYNHAHYLPQFFESIFSQNFDNLEIIITDDASTDNTLEVLEYYQRKIPYLRVYRNETNQGPVVTVNQAIQHARGKYLNFCSSDDCLLPGFCTQLVQWLELNPSAAICCSDPCFFEGEVLDPAKLRVEKLGTEDQIFHPETFWKYANNGFWIAGHATMYRKDILISHGLFAAELFHSCDWFLHFEIAAQYPIGYVARPLAALRCTPQSYSGCTSPQKRQLIADRVMNRLKAKKYKRLRQFFRRTGLLRHFGMPAFLIMLKTPLYWSHIPIIARKFGWDYCKRRFLKRICG